MAKLPWEGAHFSFYCNKECEYFPCHPNADPERFNCLFCYCPLYALGRKCGGDFTYTSDGIKDCTHCLFPHIPENYPKIVGRYGQLLKIVKQLDRMAEERTQKAREARLAREAAKAAQRAEGAQPDQTDAFDADGPDAGDPSAGARTAERPDPKGREGQ